MSNKSIFINTSGAEWILQILGDDIYNGLTNMGFKCRKGEYHEYEGEDISFHMWWRRALPYEDAKVNAIFVTHVDDSIKEHDLVSMKDKFDLFFCMSPEDAIFLEELGFEKNKVFGLNLPTRNTYIRPITIAVFSNCYPKMKTKNEQWLVDYCSSHKNSRLVNFCFIGRDWGEIGIQLSKFGCSFEWHCVDRSLPYEYMFQQLKLANADYYLYMGMDGGAMGTYDAYAMGLELCVADDGYHKCIPDQSLGFLNQEEFNSCMDRLIEKQVRRYNFFKINSVENYVNTVAYILMNGRYPEEPVILENLNYSVKEKRRTFYFPLSLKRLKQPLVTMFIKSILKSNLKEKKKMCNNCSYKNDLK